MNNIIKILIVLLTIFIFTTCFFGYNLFIKKESKTTSYTCVKELESKDQGFNLELSYTMIVNKDGSIASGLNTTSYIYLDKQVYKTSKEYYEKNPSDTDKYEFDDKINTIKVSSNDTNIKLKDDKGNINEIWYKTYLNNYISLGYTCK